MNIGTDRFKACSILALTFNGQAINGHPLYLAVFHQGNKIRVAHLLGRSLRIKVVENGQQHCRNNEDRKSTRLNSSHVKISYAVFCLKKKKIKYTIKIEK